MSTQVTPTQISGSLQQVQFELDGFVLAIHPATVAPSVTDWQMSLWDDAGNQIFDYRDIGSSPAWADISNLWHVRDDGNGAFTLYYLSDHLGSRTPTMQSFDANGDSLGTQTYELPSRTIDIGGIPIEQTLLEAYADAVDLGNGRVAAFNHDGSLGTGHTVVIYNQDGSIRQYLNWDDPTLTGTGAAATNGLEISVSGDNLFIFHMNTGLGGNNDFEVYGRVVDQSGNFVTDEFRVSNGTHTQGTFGFGSGQVVSETLADGKVVVAWVSNRADTSATGTVDVWFAIYNANGSLFAAEQLANVGMVASQQGEPRVHALADGSFAVTYNSDNYSAFENTGVIQCFDANGNAVGDPITGLPRFTYTDRSVIFENGFGYLADSGGHLYTVELPVDGGSSGPVPTNGNDSLSGTNQRDVISGLRGNDEIDGLRGNDKLSGNGGKDTLDGGGGKDKLLGGGGRDKLFGGGGNDTLNGGGGNDTLKGGGGRDQLDGGGGRDWLDGGGGADRLNGGSGNDTLKGGAGSDTFIFGSRIGNDVITDYNEGTDSLRISSQLWDGNLTQARLNALSDYSSGNLVIDFGNGHSISFEGINTNAGLLDDITLF